MAVTTQQVAELYVATFNRAPDAAGLAYWISDGTSATTTLTDINAIARAMQAGAEAESGVGSMTNTEYVISLYSSMFGRTVTAADAGVTYWVDQMTAGSVDRANLIQTLIAGAQASTGSATDAAMLANKTTVGLAFAAAGLNNTADAASVLASVTSDAATVTAAQTSIDTLVTEAAQASATQLTTSTDSFVGTTGNDSWNAAAGTLADADLILDSSTTDADVLYAEVTANNIAPRLQNVETINVTGKYVTTGLALTSVAGTVDLNVNTTLAGGTATVTDANSINALNINAGANISTLKVTSLASGTRDTVNVDGGSANVTITGNASGADKYSVTAAAGKTVTVGTMDSAGDTLTVNAAGSFTLVTDATGANLTVNVNNTSSGTATVTSAAAGLVAKTMTLAGGDTVVDFTGSTDALDGLAVTSTATSSTIKVNSTAAATTGDINLNKAVVTNVNVAKDLGDNLVVNSGTVVNLTATQTGTDTIGVDNTAGDLTTGTLLLNVSHDQTKITTSAKTDTVLLTATPDQSSDTVDTNGNTQQINITDLVLNAATTTVVVNGSNALDLGVVTINNAGTIALGTAEVVSAGSMTGNLTISKLSNDAKVYAGSGNDSITTKTAKVYEIHAGAGNDTIDLNTTAAASAGSTVYGDAGNDTITTGTNGATVDGGTGNDTIISNGVDTITTGAGADTVILATANGSTISDFTTGEDKIVVTGSAAGNVDLTNTTATSGAYNIDGAATADFTITGSTTTNLTSIVQLGNSDNVYAASTNTVVAGSHDDVISVSTGTITTGAGADTVIVTGNATITDFTAGTDKVEYTAAITAAATSINLTNITPASGTYTLDGTKTLKLTGHTETNIGSMVQLGNSTTAFDVSGSTAVSLSVTGGTYNDYIKVGAGNTAINFIDNGGVDTITNFTSAGGDTFKFGGMTGINTGAGLDKTAITAKIADAVDGSVYILSGAQSVNSDTIDFSVIGTTVNNETVTINTTSVVNDVVGYLNNTLGTTTGEHYVVAIEDSTNTKSYFYFVNGNTTGITSSDISLIGSVDSATLVAADIA